MGYASIRLLLLLAVAIAATAFTFRFAWKQEVIGRKHATVCAALFLLGALSLVPGVRERATAISWPDDETAGRWLLFSTMGFAVLLGLLLSGKRALRDLAAGTAARLRLAVEEFRDPRLRAMNVCIRRYQRALRILARPVPGRPHRLQRNRLYVAATLRRISDEDIKVLADSLNVSMFGGIASADRLVAFLQEERQMALADLTAASGHLVRLTRLAEQIRRGIAARQERGAQ